MYATYGLRRFTNYDVRDLLPMVIAGATRAGYILMDDISHSEVRSSRLGKAECYVGPGQIAGSQ